MKIDTMCTKILLTAGMSVLWVGALSAGPVRQEQVAQAVFAATDLARQTAAHEVQVQLMWKRAVTLGQRMLRPARFSASADLVVRVEEKQTRCQGVLSQQGQVLFPTECLKQGDFSLAALTLRFANQHQKEVKKEELLVRGDIAWVSGCASVSAGLVGLPIQITPQDQSLQAFYGEEMTQRLKEFFHARQVKQTHRNRLGSAYFKPLLRVGEPLLYRGKVVALVKKTVPSYGGLFGAVSESAFALIR